MLTLFTNIDKKSIIAGTLRYLLCTIFLLCFTPARSGEKDVNVQVAVDSLVLSVRVHGIEYQEARRLGSASLPRLAEILEDAEKSRSWVNAVITLGFLGGDGMPLLERFIRKNPTSADLNGSRARAAALFAVGLAGADRQDDRARSLLDDELRLMLSKAGAGDANAMTWAEIESALIGISFVDSTLQASIFGQQLSEQDADKLTSAVAQALEIRGEVLAQGYEDYFSYRKPKPTLDDGPERSSLQVNAVRHVEANYSDSEFDSDLRAAERVLFGWDPNCSGNDVICAVAFSRTAPIGAFGTVGDGLNFINSEARLNSVFSVSSARVKFVSSLDYCGTFNPSIIGCARTPGNSIILETGWSGTSLFAHEYGHNVGLGHRDACVNNLMNSFLTSTGNGVVNRGECAAFGGTVPPSESPVPVRSLAVVLETLLESDFIFNTGFEPSSGN